MGPARWWIVGVSERSAVGKKTGPNPPDRRTCGSKPHVLTDGQGVPVAALVTGAHRHEVTQLLPLLEAIPPVRGTRGRPRRRPRRVQGDRGSDSEPHRQALRARGIPPVLAKRGTPHGSGLGIYRWVVERTLAWLPQWRRLRVRYERRADIHEAFLTRGCARICWRYLL
jgi:transposase